MKRTTALLLAFAVALSLATPAVAASDAAVPAIDGQPTADWGDDDDEWGSDDDDEWGSDDDTENDCENEELGYDHHPTCIDTDGDIDLGSDDSEADGRMTAGSPSGDDPSACRNLGREMAEWRNADSTVGIATKWHAVAAYGDCVRQNTDDDEEDGWYYND